MNFFKNLIYKFISIRQVLKYLKDYDIVDEIPVITSIDYFWPSHSIGKFNTNNRKIKEITFLEGLDICVSLGPIDGHSKEFFFFKTYYHGIKVVPSRYRIDYSDSISQEAFIDSEEIMLTFREKNRNDAIRQYVTYTKNYKEKAFQIERIHHFGDNPNEDQFVAKITFYRPVLESAVNFNFNKFIYVE